MVHCILIRWHVILVGCKAIDGTGKRNNSDEHNLWIAPQQIPYKVFCDADRFRAQDGLNKREEQFPVREYHG